MLTLAIIACGLVIAAGALVFLPALYWAVRDVARSKRRALRHPIAPERYERALREAHADKLRRVREKLARERGQR